MLQYSVTEGVPAVLEQVRRFANRHELRVRGQDALLLCTGSQQVLDLATKCLCNCLLYTSAQTPIRPWRPPLAA